MTSDHWSPRFRIAALMFASATAAEPRVAQTASQSAARQGEIAAVDEVVMTAQRRSECLTDFRPVDETFTQVSWTEPSDRVTFSIYGQNLTNEHSCSVVTQQSESWPANHGWPRTFGGEISWRF